MNRKIRLLLTIDSFMMIPFGLLAPIYAIYVEKIGGDILDAGVAFAIFSITLGFFSYLIGKIGDKVRNDYKLLFAGLMISAIGFFSYLLVKNSFHMMIVQFILGIGQAMYNPIYDAVFSTNLDKNKKDSEWADWESLNYLVGGITAIAGAWLVSVFGFETLFVLMGLSSLFSVILVHRLKNQSLR